MSDERMFLVLGGKRLKRVPWRLLEPYTASILRVHGQTMQRLNERGGLGAGEMRAHISGDFWKTLREHPDEDANEVWLEEWLRARGST